MEPYVPPMWTPSPSYKGTQPVSVPFLDPDTVQVREFLLIISLHSGLSDYIKTRGEVSDEGHELADEVKRQTARQETMDKSGFLCALWMIHQGVLVQADGVKSLIDIAEGTDVVNLPTILPILGPVTGPILVHPVELLWRQNILRDCRLPMN